MSAYVIFTRERIRNQAEVDKYSALARPAMAGHRLEPLVAYGKCETLEGAPVDAAVVLEFPTMEAAKAWYDSPAYTEARQHRFKGADYRVFITAGV
ncbi:DUF1330 domain-containing protein [Bradyrhizobium liaoningense]